MSQAAGQEDGLTARAALRLLCPELVRSDVELWSGGITWVDAEYDEILRPTPVLLELLAEGAWHATGYRAPLTKDSRREHIPSHLWDVLDINRDDDTASGGGLEYVGVRYFEGEHKRLKSTASAETQCRKWLFEEMKAPKSKQKTDYEAEALNERFEGLAGIAFVRAWAAALKEPTTHPSWRKRGPVGKFGEGV